MIRRMSENDHFIEKLKLIISFVFLSLICYDIKRSIPDLTKITDLSFTTLVPNHQIYPSVTFTHSLLKILPNVNDLCLSYNYLLQLLESPEVTKKLSERIHWLQIIFDNDSPLFEDMIRIINIFSKNLYILRFEFHHNFPYNTFYFIFPLIMRRVFTKLMWFYVNLRTHIAQEHPLAFTEEFKMWLNQHLMTINKNQSKVLEYKIKNKQFEISFSYC